jgi:predicted Zn finger-like uncharacterized protein
MIISCTSCGTKYKYDETKLEGVISKKVRCPKCKTVIEVFNPITQAKKPFTEADQMEKTHSAAPKRVAPTAKRELVTQPMTDEEMAGPRTASVNRESAMAEVMAAEHDEYLKLSESRRFSLAVIQGFNAGEIFPINKPKMLIGRSDSDIIVILRDLSSTNGTFVNEQRITTVNLENQQEFRIGTTIFMLIITDIE